jgi:hypothetical protein
MLTKRQLFLSALILLAGFAAMNLLVSVLERNAVPRRVMRHARESKSAAVLTLGNSLVRVGFDESAFNSAAGVAPNRGSAGLGLGGSSTVEQLLLLRYALAHGMRPQLLIYGFWDFQLSAPNEFRIGDLIGNHAMLYYVEPAYASRFYSLSWHDNFEFRAMHVFPMFADRGGVWAHVEILRRTMEQQGMPAQRSNQLGRAADFALLEARSAEEFRLNCEYSMKMPLALAVSELLRQASDAGLTVVVVEMPMPQAHRTLFYDTPWWRDYVAQLRVLLAPYRVVLVDAGDWIPDDSLFVDSVHLTKRGAAQFSQHLGASLAGELLSVSVHSGGVPESKGSRP